MGLTVQYSIIRSDRKTIAIQIQPDGEVLVRAPKRMRMDEIKRFVESKAGWIEKHLSNRTEQNQQKLTDLELKALREKACALVTDRVLSYAPLIGVTYNQISLAAAAYPMGQLQQQGKSQF